MAKQIHGLGILLLASIVGCTQQSDNQVPSNSGSRPMAELDTQIASASEPKSKVYDESANGLEQIADALTSAKQGDKRILLQFGAEWCGWCHKLHHLFESDAAVAAKLKAGYVVVLIDVNEDHNKEVVNKYENPTRFGLPVIVLLDADGTQLTTKDTAELEDGDHHSPEKVMAFLEEWSPASAEVAPK